MSAKLRWSASRSTGTTRPLRRRDRDADVVVVLVDDVVAVDLGVDGGSSFSAAMQAFTKKDMKPSFTPCFFSKSSL
jgi:predicted phosphoribosyltransferase